MMIWDVKNVPANVISGDKSTTGTNRESTAKHENPKELPADKKADEKRLLHRERFLS